MGGGRSSKFKTYETSRHGLRGPVRPPPADPAGSYWSLPGGSPRVVRPPPPPRNGSALPRSAAHMRDPRRCKQSQGRENANRGARRVLALGRLLVGIASGACAAAAGCRLTLPQLAIDVSHTVCAMPRRGAGDRRAGGKLIYSVCLYGRIIYQCVGPYHSIDRASGIACDA